MINFKQWLSESEEEELYHGANAPDNNPENAINTKFEILKREIADYVDELADLAVPGRDANEKTKAAFKSQIEEFDQKRQGEITRFIDAFTGWMYLPNNR